MANKKIFYASFRETGAEIKLEVDFDFVESNKDRITEHARYLYGWHDKFVYYVKKYHLDYFRAYLTCFVQECFLYSASHPCDIHELENYWDSTKNEIHHLDDFGISIISFRHSIAEKITGIEVFEVPM